jgi:hypothetical protein
MPQRRALVVDDELAAHSWWACTLVIGAHKREPCIRACNHEAALKYIASDDNTGTVLITAEQAELILGRRVSAMLLSLSKSRFLWARKLALTAS